MYSFYTDSLNPTRYRVRVEADSHLDGVKLKSMFYNKDLVYTDFKKEISILYSLPLLSGVPLSLNQNMTREGNLMDIEEILKFW